MHAMKALMICAALLAVLAAGETVVQSSSGDSSTSTVVTNGKSLVVTNGVAYANGVPIGPPAPSPGTWNTVVVTSQCDGSATTTYTNVPGRVGISSSIVNACGGSSVTTSEGGGGLSTFNGGQSVQISEDGNIVANNNGQVVSIG